MKNKIARMALMYPNHIQAGSDFNISLIPRKLSCPKSVSCKTK